MESPPPQIPGKEATHEERQKTIAVGKSHPKMHSIVEKLVWSQNCRVSPTGVLDTTGTKKQSHTRSRMKHENWYAPKFHQTMMTVRQCSAQAERLACSQQYQSDLQSKSARPPVGEAPPAGGFIEELSLPGQLRLKGSITLQIEPRKTAKSSLDSIEPRRNHICKEGRNHICNEE